jgi:hypothetical protein
MQNGVCGAGEGGEARTGGDPGSQVTSTAIANTRDVCGSYVGLFACTELNVTLKIRNFGSVIRFTSHYKYLIGV